jgi:PDZ domain-containing secreted protein
MVYLKFFLKYWNYKAQIYIDQGMHMQNKLQIPHRISNTDTTQHTSRKETPQDIHHREAEDKVAILVTEPEELRKFNVNQQPHQATEFKDKNNDTVLFFISPLLSIRPYLLLS